MPCSPSTHQSLGWQARFVAAFNVDHHRCTDLSIYNTKFEYALLASGDRDRDRLDRYRPELDPALPHATVSGLAEWSWRRGPAPAQGVLTSVPRTLRPGPDQRDEPDRPRGDARIPQLVIQITEEVINARVWEGIHFRFSDVVGAQVGGEVARYDLRRLQTIGL